MKEELLSGGNINHVIRIGDTVRRPWAPWSPTIQALLRHVRARGFLGSPEVLGRDEQGRDVLSYLEGQVACYPAPPAFRSSAVLESAARLLRAFHDATVDFTREGQWQLPARLGAEVICHGDIGPHNSVLRAGRIVGFIDFDTAHPGPRVWDVAYAAYRFAPMTALQNRDGFGDTPAQAARVRRFCSAYGLDPSESIAEAAISRLKALVDFMRERAAASDPGFLRNIEAGHLNQYLSDIEYIDAQRDVFDASAECAGRG